MELDDPIAALRYICHCGGQLSVAKGQLCAGLRLSARAAQALPAAIAQIPQQHQFHAAAGFAAPQKPCRQNTGII